VSLDVDEISSDFLFFFSRRQYDGQLVAYYSDQRDPLHGQKLAHQTSRDMIHWGPVVNDVAYDLYEARPGMTVIDYIKPLKKWILVHELPIGNSSSYGYVLRRHQDQETRR
jgi:hypothetical protein